jgi:hypothetical protein
MDAFALIGEPGRELRRETNDQNRGNGTPHLTCKQSLWHATFQELYRLFDSPRRGLRRETEDRESKGEKRFRSSEDC